VWLASPKRRGCLGSAGGCRTSPTNGRGERAGTALGDGCPTCCSRFEPEACHEATTRQIVVGELLVSGALAGCATTVDWGGPLFHYRYNYDSRPVVSEAPVVVPAPAVTPNEPAVVYHESTVSRDPDSVVTYRTYRDPIVTYYDRPTVIDGYQSPAFPYIDKGQ